MAYYTKIKSGKVHLYDTNSNSVISVFSNNVKDIDIQKNEIVVYKKNGKIELYKINRNNVKGPYQVR